LDKFKLSLLALEGQLILDPELVILDDGCKHACGMDLSYREELNES